jgi:hypothetical protein
MKKFFLLATLLIFFGAVDAQVVIRQGKYSSGDARYNWDGKVLRQGKYSSGDAILNVDGKIPTAVLIFIAQ